MKQVLQIGDRVVFDITEPATISLPASDRICPGSIKNVGTRHFGTEFEEITYRVLLDRMILGERTWTLNAKPGVMPKELKPFREGGDAKCTTPKTR